MLIYLKEKYNLENVLTIGTIEGKYDSVIEENNDLNVFISANLDKTQVSNILNTSNNQQWNNGMVTKRNARKIWKLIKSD